MTKIENMNREQMLRFLTEARSEHSRAFWDTFDDANLRLQVKLVKRQMEQQTADYFATA